MAPTKGLKRAIASAELSLGKLAASAKSAGDKAAVGLAQVKAGVSVISEQITTTRTQLLAFLSINWATGKLQEIVQVADAYFVKNDRGNVVPMAENIGEHDRPLAGFKRRYRKAEGVKRIKRGADVPIAVLVPRVVLRKRLDIDQLVARRIPRLAAAIEARIRQLG
ncbi:DUF6441 family protein [Ralstonia pseudosolanacearum]|uniref:DUF6441 family protein n=1 Tax=Ralstonia pseudosolanacearum TaxID=1310165 RepID=UPI00267495A4|nr:DUF6441 family protein [Ralstonia pseudosolanacearum]MDO3524738.1 DUF6441 family protein [Ralstonia pseudosolanacearum]MDO3549685.1 DUF6441 family protein [Ralstonia pseudosolanacearum]MDO3554429.1 DUF6441 family protein [Ralstonia pseudosolanacearum]MDO3569149.1 DUF6441 family protein [Ralstonia pseudosolanacearum]MDO3584080.1 DUF6441 family protein [Ralstonia pseudosolanacearum]